MKTNDESVTKMWQAFINSIGESVESTDKTFSSWHFEITEEGANNLANLVLAGKKEQLLLLCGLKNMIMV